ncbi:respiratory-chain NADH dehydrogenase- 49 kd subunit domain-containing protein [Apiospora arundinis]
MKRFISRLYHHRATRTTTRQQHQPIHHQASRSRRQARCDAFSMRDDISVVMLPLTKRIS